MNYQNAMKIGVLGLAMGLASACSNPDTEASYADFLDRTEDHRQIPDMGTPDGGMQVDFSGDYFLSLKTLIGPTTPFYLITTISVDEDFIADFSLQPIKSDNDPLNGNEPRDDARSPVGEPLIATDVQVAEDGTWTAVFVDAILPAEGNPISGAQIRADINLHGTVLGPQSTCGTADGQVYEPLMLPLKGSEFGTVWIDDPSEIATISPVATCDGDPINNVNNVNNTNNVNNVNNTNNVNNSDDMGDDMTTDMDDMGATDMADMADADM